MAFSFLSFRRYVFHALFVSVLFTSQAIATLEPMREWELGGVEARTGVNLHFDNLVIEKNGDSMRFVPDDTAEPDNYVELTGMKGKRTVNGDLSIELGAYEAPQRDWFIKETAKVRKGSGGLGTDWYFKHKRKDYTIVKGSDYRTDAEARGIDAVTLGMGNGTDIFMSQNSSMGLSFSVDGRYTDPSVSDISERVKNGLLDVDSGTLSVSAMKTCGQQITLYSIHDIPGYVTGEGIALEIRSKSSIDQIALSAPDGTMNALVKGVHMRESFDQQVHSLYGKWGDMDSGYFASDDPSEYFQSTYDPDGYYGHTWDPQDTPVDPTLIKTPYDGGPDYYNMYDGYMMNGNINQIAFYDLISGKKLPYDHGQVTAHDTITGNNFDDPDKLDDDYQVRSQAAADAIAIEERPMTIQVKTGRTYKRYDAGAGGLVDTYDDRSYVAINWPRHGSVRVEEVQGFVSKDGAPYNAFGPSMGSVILDGMRAKKTCIEIPGRAEQYLITEQNINKPDPDNWVRHHYVYNAGKLPDEMNPNGLPLWGQPEWDPIGRGQIDFLNKLGQEPEAVYQETNPVLYANPRWELYDTKKVVGGVTYDFWHLYEPAYPGSGTRWTPDH